MAFDALAMAAPYILLVRAAAEMYFGVPAPVPVVLAQIEQESAFDPAARSRAGAMGLMQFMPGTASWAGEQTGRAARPFDPTWSIQTGIWYDRWLYDRVKYPTDCDRWGAALSSYNGGLGNHNKRQAASSHPADFWYWVATVRPPSVSEANQRENYDYPRRIVFDRQRKFDAPGYRLVCIYRHANGG